MWNLFSLQFPLNFNRISATRFSFLFHHVLRNMILLAAWGGFTDHRVLLVVIMFLQKYYLRLDC